MEQKTAHDFDQDLLILFDAYVHGVIDRRSFLDQASRFAVGGVTGVDTAAAGDDGDAVPPRQPAARPPTASTTQRRHTLGYAHRLPARPAHHASRSFCMAYRAADARVETPIRA